MVAKVHTSSMVVQNTTTIPIQSVSSKKAILERELGLQITEEMKERQEIKKEKNTF